MFQKFKAHCPKINTVHTGWQLRVKNGRNLFRNEKWKLRSNAIEVTTKLNYWDVNVTEETG